MVGSSNNQILNNRAVGNGTAIADFFFDLQDISLNNDCDSNTWVGNTFATADPVCTTIGGHQVPAPTSSREASKSTQPARPTHPTDLPLVRHFPST